MREQGVSAEHGHKKKREQEAAAAAAGPPPDVPRALQRFFQK